MSMTTDEIRCARHPDTVTNLRCSRCEKPVCVRCMVYTPVGIRCRECAVERRSGINAPSTPHVARAALAGAGAAIVIAPLWGLFPEYAFWLALLLGFAGGDLVNMASGRKRGPELRVVGAGMVIATFLLAAFISATLETGMTSRVVFHTLMAAIALYLSTARQG